jgi:hypothetical protein
MLSPTTAPPSLLSLNAAGNCRRVDDRRERLRRTRAPSFRAIAKGWEVTNPNPPALFQGAAFTRAEASREKTPPKLKTPETEASGVSILITRSTAVVVSSGSPSGRPPAFAGAATSGCAGFQNSNFRRRPALQLDRWPTFRLGSVSCPSARPVANLRLASAVPHLRSTFGDPSSLRLTILAHRACAQQSWFHPACAKWALPPARPTTYFRLTSDVVLWLGWRLHTACATCCPCPPAGFASSLHRLLHPPSSPAVNLSACASWLLLRLSL